ncbi:alpha-1,6-mannosyltransferase [Micromonospora pattaloongensis]|uniref:Alpha-1,6-mannosyltransferase n=1 Tax=Micromonospora pattaloongensis TaxID=405436 RepID=A0A1H3PV31_9ACTN|nr:polyprenol phosphomannose-dependent alpha 1,6 mannosyltransferase MptB [Micromonospora pattaloongensis]SDZ05134.1 alpha-1,6-mannosyltransferase [Micromonospora pattaloongensis]
MPGAPRYSVIRYAGFVGALLLAVAAYLGGALPPLPRNRNPVELAQHGNGAWVLLTWLLGTGLLFWAWWSARHADPPLRWIYVTVGLWLLPLLVAPPLGSRDVYSYACQGAVYDSGGDPYTHGVAELGCPWLSTVTPMWRDTPAPYGPVFVLLAGAAVALGGTLWGSIALLRALAVVGVVLMALCVPPLARRRGIPPGRALWLALACPLVAVHLVSGAHNDALMVGLLVAGLLVVAARPGRPGAQLGAGLLLGLAVAIKITAVVVLPFAALAAIPGRYRLPALLRHGAWVGVGAIAAILGSTLVSGLGLGWIGGLSHSGDSVQWTAPPTALGIFVEYLGRPFGLHYHAVPVTRALSLLVLAVVLVVLWWRARHRDPVFYAGLALAATVALAPVFHPWYATWPLAVLAATARRTRWFLIPVAVAVFLTLPDGNNLARFTKFQGTIVMVVLIVWVTHRALRWTRAQRRPHQTHPS